MILPLDLISIIFSKIDSFGLILSLTSKDFNDFYGKMKNKSELKLGKLLSSMSVSLIEYIQNFKIIHNNKTILCGELSKSGNLEVLKWARENGCQWNSSTCSNAASGGHLEVLKWARDNGCKWDINTCYNAAGGGARLINATKLHLLIAAAKKLKTFSSSFRSIKMGP